MRNVNSNEHQVGGQGVLTKEKWLIEPCSYINQEVGCQETQGTSVYAFPTPADKDLEDCKFLDDSGSWTTEYQCEDGQ